MFWNRAHEGKEEEKEQAKKLKNNVTHKRITGSYLFFWLFGRI